MLSRSFLQCYAKHIFKNIARFKSTKTVALEDISCFGTLQIRTSRLPTVISSLDPHEIPNGDKAFIEAWSNENVNLQQLLSVKYDKDESVITILDGDSSVIPDDTSLSILIPHNYNIDVEAPEIHLKETEGRDLKLHSTGNCILGKIKSFNTSVNCQGSLTCIDFQGNGLLSGLAGVDIRKVQSINTTVHANSHIKISAVYAQEFICETTGDIELGSLHGNSVVKAKDLGAVAIAAAAGDLTIQTEGGSINTTLEQCTTVNIASDEGDIDVGLSDSISAYIEAEASSIDIPEDLLFDGLKRETSSGYQLFEGKLGDGKATINLKSLKGSISFSRQSLFSKYKLED